MFKRTWSQKIDGDLATDLEKLKKDFVITVADKAQNNILFTCKYFYIKTLKEELTRPGQLTYQLFFALKSFFQLNIYVRSLVFR